MIHKEKLQELYKDACDGAITVVINRPDKTDMVAGVIAALKAVLPPSVGVEVYANKNRNKFHATVVIPPSLLDQLTGVVYDFSQFNVRSDRERRGIETRRYLGCHDEDQTRLPIPDVSHETINVKESTTPHDVCVDMSTYISKTLQSYFNTPPRNPGTMLRLVVSDSIPDTNKHKGGEWINEKTINQYRKQILQASQGAYHYVPSASASSQQPIAGQPK